MTGRMIFMRSMRPSKVGKNVEFVIQKELTRGLFGVAYFGHLKSNHTPVVIKILLDASTIECSPEMIAYRERSFRQEIEFHATLSHPNIAKYIYGESKNPNPLACYLIVEWSEQGDLVDFINRRKGVLLSLPMFTYFCKSIAQSVNYLHQKNLLHRDINEENVLIQERNGHFCLKLSDFGFMTQYGEEGEVYEDLLLGTPNYMAPEIWDERCYSQKSDVFALGSLFYVLATFSRPFDFDAHEDIDNAICNTQQMIPEHVPSDISDLISKCWKKNRFSRPLITDILNHTLFKPLNKTPSLPQAFLEQQPDTANENMPLLASSTSDEDSELECYCVIS